MNIEAISQEVKIEDKILKVLEEFYQVRHSDLKALVQPIETEDSFSKALQKLRAKDKIRYISGIGALYWRYNLPIRRISKKKYTDALETIDAYVRHLEGKKKKKRL